MREPYSATWNYHVALYRGDDLVDTGTLKEVADRQGVLPSTIRWYLSNPAHERADKARNKTKGLRAVRTDKIADDEIF